MSKVAYLFPGQGSQKEGMGYDIWEAVQSVRKIFTVADMSTSTELSKLCFDGPAEELQRTINAQPALVTACYAYYIAASELLGDKLPRADYIAGHSLGEYTALVVAEVSDFSTIVGLAKERGRLMEEAGSQSPGAMAAIIALSPEKVEEICSATGTWIANLNSPGQIVISGNMDDVDDASEMAEDAGAKYAIPLDVSGAFHSPLMAPAAEGLKDIVRNDCFSDPKITVIGNTNAQEINTSDGIKTELIEQLCSCVKWQQTMEWLIAKGVTTFIEFGPGEVLTGIVERMAPDAKAISIGSLEDIKNFG